MTPWCLKAWGLRKEVYAMFETIARLYKKTGNAEVVEKAAAKGWISQEEKENLLAG